MIKYLLILLALLGQACGDKYPATDKGGRITGTIRYRGTTLGTMRRPAVRTLASLAFPPGGPLHAMLINDSPVLTAALTGPGLPYELVWLAPYSYKVSAQLIDLDNPSIDYSALPVGGYPDYCSLLRPDEGKVRVTDDTPTVGVNFTLYDNAGTGDPCTQALCPQQGKSTMRIVVNSSQVPTGNDRLRVALFQTFPAAIPSSLRIIPGAQLSFPWIITDNTLAPGSYTLASVCLDIGANSGTEKCTDEDFESSHRSPSPPLEFPPNTIVTITADLDAKTFTVDGIDAPSKWGCL